MLRLLASDQTRYSINEIQLVMLQSTLLCILLNFTRGIHFTAEKIRILQSPRLTSSGTASLSQTLDPVLPSHINFPISNVLMMGYSYLGNRNCAIQAGVLNRVNRFKTRVG